MGNRTKWCNMIQEVPEGENWENGGKIWKVQSMLVDNYLEV